MITIGPNLVVVGELHSDEDIVIAGRLEGSIVCEPASVVISETADVRGDVIGRDITVHGRISGRLIATEFVELTAKAVVTSQVMSPRFILALGAQFTGRVDPQHVDAAIRVARFEQKKRETVSTPVPLPAPARA